MHLLSFSPMHGWPLHSLPTTLDHSLTRRIVVPILLPLRSGISLRPLDRRLCHEPGKRACGARDPNEPCLLRNTRTPFSRRSPPTAPDSAHRVRTNPLPSGAARVGDPVRLHLCSRRPSRPRLVSRFFASLRVRLPAPSVVSFTRAAASRSAAAHSADLA
ncbi:hypothetical protein ACCO45_005206 [Purpureocillium lilacinum]|uniref:Uncharacterized protein n=1 Tax=Purpureocillium lilacinum TaxID=33203 RepID=A0ACC4DX08_PURLI